MEFQCHIWANVFFYCFEHDIDFSVLVEEMKEIISIPFEFANERKGMIYSTVELELNYLMKYLQVPASVLLDENNLEKRTLKFCQDKVSFEGEESFIEDEKLHIEKNGCFDIDFYNDFCNRHKRDAEIEINENWYSYDVKIGKQFNFNTYCFEYYVYLSFTEAIEKLRATSNLDEMKFLEICRNRDMDNAFCGPIELWRGTSGKICDYIDKELGLEKDYRVLDFKDIVIKTSFQKCSKENHKIEIVNGIICIYDPQDKEIICETVPVLYCANCNVYYIQKLDFDELNLKGKLLCNTINYNEWVAKQYTKFTMLSNESIFKLCGYTVNMLDDISDSERQNILKFMISRNIVSKQQTINFLTWLINTHKDRSAYYEAVNKWKNDLKYIKKELWSGRNIIIGNINN